MASRMAWAKMADAKCSCSSPWSTTANGEKMRCPRGCVGKASGPAILDGVQVQPMVALEPGVAWFLLFKDDVGYAAVLQLGTHGQT